MADISKTPKEKIRVLVIDLGTTMTKARIFDGFNNVLCYLRKETEIIKPTQDGSEINGDMLWKNALTLCKDCIAQSGLNPTDITCMGITTQRESFLIWDNRTKDQLCNINTWQDRRGVQFCSEWNESTVLKAYKNMCWGKLYFSNSPSLKLTANFRFIPNMTAVRLKQTTLWNPNLKTGLDNSSASFGTIDSWMAYKLTNGQKYVTDAASASVTGYYDAADMAYHYHLILFLQFDQSKFPNVINTHGRLFETSQDVLGARIPVTCLIGDQQASAFGCGCINIGDTKATFGTGLFIDTYTGHNIVPVFDNMCYPVVGWMNDAKQVAYLYEARNDFAHSNVQQAFATKNLKSMESLDRIANNKRTPEDQSVNIDTNEAMSLLNEMITTFFTTWKTYIKVIEQYHKITSIRVDGGYCGSDYVLQGISSLTGLPVIRMKDMNSTSLGAYFLARCGAGFNSKPEEFGQYITYEKKFTPIEEHKKSLLKTLGVTEK